MHDVVDIEACVASIDRQWEDTGFSHPIKLREDLERYRAIIDRTEPDVVIETGTYTGRSAAWFAAQGVNVITIDLADVTNLTLPDGATALIGSSTDPDVYSRVVDLVADKRVMVSLDSDHDAGHVEQEINQYSRLVSPGCYLVVEDGISRWLGFTLSPLDAIERTLAQWPDWRRDTDVEAMYPITMHVGGWWLREEPDGSLLR